MIDILKGLIKQFMPFAQEKMGFDRPPKLFLRQDHQNPADPLGKTGFYDVEKESITLYTTGRHPKDILRSLAHELQHHTQKCNGEFDNIKNMGEEGYAQNNPQLRTMEFKAYMASMCVRDFEDGLKLQRETIYYEHLQKGDKGSMSTKKWKNEELKTLLTESWGFKMDLSNFGKLEEYSGPGVDRGPDDKPSAKKAAKKETKGKEESKREEEGIEDVKEGCGDHDEAGGMEMMVTGGEMGPEGQMGGESDVEGLAGELLSLAHRIGDALGVDSEVTSMGDEEDAEDLEERRGRGRKGPHIRGPEDPRLREMVRKIVREALKGK